MFLHRLGVVRGQRLTERLVASVGLPDPGLQHLPRRLAGPEPWQANLLGEPSERSVEIFLELRLLDLDDDLDLVALEGLDGGLHSSKCTATPLDRET